MNKEIEECIRPGARLILVHGPYPSTPPRCEKAVIILGNVAGFRSLAEILCWCRNDLEEPLCVSELPFVESRMEHPFVIDLNTDEVSKRAEAGIVVQSETTTTWRLSDLEVGLVTMAMHGLGYAWNHLHFDPSSAEYTCGVYCGLE